jgi:hypothetical protein
MPSPDWSGGSAPDDEQAERPTLTTIPNTDEGTVTFTPAPGDGVGVGVAATEWITVAVEDLVDVREHR